MTSSLQNQYRQLFLASAFLSILAASAHANITYVDAVEGASGNTFATGGSPSNTNWLSTVNNANAIQSQWARRSLVGNGGTVFQARHSIPSTMPELTTQITGLANGTYDVWVFFWDASTSNTWTISAGLTTGSLTTYSFDGLGDRTATKAASTLSFTAIPMTAEADRIMYGVNLGKAIVAGGNAIDVYLDNLVGGDSVSRTWYDGVGYSLSSADPPLPSARPPIQIAPDGTWTWFNDERAIWHLGKLYCGYVRSDGYVGISQYDPTTGETNHTRLSSFSNINDHNNPSITVLPDGRLLVVYAIHIGSNSYYSRTSLATEPSSISDWSAETVRDTGSRVTYANTYRLSEESDRIFLFNRHINFNPAVSISDNDGNTFSNPARLIATGSGSTRPYVRYVSDHAKRIDILYTDGHPRDVNNSLYHIYYEAGVFRRTDGTLLKSLANLPINHDLGERGTLIYTYSTATWGAENGPDDWIPSGRAWNWDIHYGRDGHPVAAFQVQLDNVTGTGWNHDRIYYYYARWTGTTWQRRFIAHAGRGLYSSEDDYGGGMAIDPDNPNVIYISTNASAPFALNDIYNVPLNRNERYEIWRGVTTDGGETFSWTPVTENSTADNLRPIVPENHGFSRNVVWFRGAYNSYISFNTEVVGVFENDLKLTDAKWEPGGAVFTWDSSPNRVYRVRASQDLLSFPHDVATGIPSQGASTSHRFLFPPEISGSPAAFFRVEDE